MSPSSRFESISVDRYQTAIDAQVSLSVVDQQVWAPHESLGFAPATVLREEGKDDLLVCFEDNTQSIVKRSQAPPVSPGTLDGIPELLDLGEFSIAILLHNVRVRYLREEIYSSIGDPILISINPYKQMPFLFSREVARKYRDGLTLSPLFNSKADEEDSTRAAAAAVVVLPPHPFKTAELTHQTLTTERKSQSIIVSGESGSGKTEATKIILRYLSSLEALQNRQPPSRSAVRETAISSSSSSSTAAVATESTPSARLVSRCAARQKGGLERQAVVADEQQQQQLTAGLETKVLMSNPILEAFGNAKTVRNDNSSRFGKYIQVFFHPHNANAISSARISHYLLEKCRLVSLHESERNFHVFYYLASFVKTAREQHHPAEKPDASSSSSRRWQRALSEGEPGFVESLQLGDDSESHAMLGTSRSMETFLSAASISWQEEEAQGQDVSFFEELLSCLDAVGIPVGEVRDIFRVVAALMHMFDFEFVPVDASAKLDGSGAKVKLKDSTHLAAVEALLQLSVGPKSSPPNGEPSSSSASSFMDLFTYRQIKDPQTGGIIKSPRSVSDARFVCTAIIKEVYSQLFDWLIMKVNQSLVPARGAGSAAGGPRRKSVPSSCSSAARSLPFQSPSARSRLVGGERNRDTVWLGLLDIYGFEVLDCANSFEQLCINFANEKLQKHFNLHMLDMEQKIYQNEGIQMSQIDFVDNQHIVDALEGKWGIFKILDDTNLLPGATDLRFLNNMFSMANFKVVHPPASSAKTLAHCTSFIVCHYAGPVEYQVEGFLQKNTDRLAGECSAFISESTSNPLMRQLFPTGEFEQMRKGSIKETVSLEFRVQLVGLMSSLTETTPTYIRCIKPNPSKVPHEFASRDVQKQLEYAGLLESIRIRNSGLGIRKSFAEFLGTYSILNAQIRKKWWKQKGATTSAPSLCAQILTEMESSFARAFPSVCAARKNSGRDMFAVGKTKVFMAEQFADWLNRARLAETSKYATKIQSLARGFIQRRRRLRAAKAADRIKSYFWILVLKRRRRERAAITLQAWSRMMLAKMALNDELARRSHAAAVIQTFCRKFLSEQRRQRIATLPTQVPTSESATPTATPIAVVHESNNNNNNSREQQEHRQQAMVVHRGKGDPAVANNATRGKRTTIVFDKQNNSRRVSVDKQASRGSMSPGQAGFARNEKMRRATSDGNNQSGMMLFQDDSSSTILAAALSCSEDYQALPQRTPDAARSVLEQQSSIVSELSRDLKKSNDEILKLNEGLIEAKMTLEVERVKMKAEVENMRKEAELQKLRDALQLKQEEKDQIERELVSVREEKERAEKNAKDLQKEMQEQEKRQRELNEEKEKAENKARELTEQSKQFITMNSLEQFKRLLDLRDLEPDKEKSDEWDHEALEMEERAYAAKTGKKKPDGTCLLEFDKLDKRFGSESQSPRGTRDDGPPNRRQKGNGPTKFKPVQKPPTIYGLSSPSLTSRNCPSNR